MLSTWMGHPRLLVVRASFLPVDRIQDLLPWGVSGTDEVTTIGNAAHLQKLI
jgi:hypothetical protein